LAGLQIVDPENTNPRQVAIAIGLPVWAVFVVYLLSNYPWNCRFTVFCVTALLYQASP
jgi:hypothetical protein